MTSARTCSALILDVDGVLTDGQFAFINGQEVKFFHAQDGLGIKRCQAKGIEVVILSGRNADCVNTRALELGISHCYQGVQDKLAFLKTLLNNLSCLPEHCICVGDDLSELPLFEFCQYGIAVCNAVAELKHKASWITQRAGGQGAVREVCDWIIAAC